MKFELPAEDMRRGRAPHELFITNLVGNHILWFVAALGILNTYWQPLMLVPILSVSTILYTFWRAKKSKEMDEKIKFLEESLKNDGLGVDPFSNITIASTCLNYYKNEHLPRDTLVMDKTTHNEKNSSYREKIWLKYLKQKLKIEILPQHKVLKYDADGYDRWDMRAKPLVRIINVGRNHSFLIAFCCDPLPDGLFL